MTIQSRPDPAVPVWATSGDIVQPTNAEVQIGWPPSTTPPSRQRFNWLIKWCFAGLRYLLQIGIGAWASGETYTVGSKVLHIDGYTYRALIDAPTSAPLVVAGEWEVWGYSFSTIQARVDQYLSKNVGGGANVTLTTDEYESGIIVLTGVLTANIQVILPNKARRWVIKNSTSGAFTLTLACPAAGTTLLVNQNQSVLAYVDGANNVQAAGSSDLANALLRANNLSDVTSPSIALANIGGVSLTAFTGGNQSLATSGYQKLPGGLIVAWATGTSTSVGAGATVTTTVTLPITFPTANLFSMVNAINASGSDGTSSIINTTTSSVSVNLSNISGATPQTPLVLAIGY